MGACGFSGNVGVCLGGTVGDQVVPGQRRRCTPEYGRAMVLHLQTRWPASRLERVPTRAGRIATVLVRPDGARRLVVYLGGNAEVFQDRLDEMRDDVDALGTAALGFNYPGVHDSGGKPSCAQDLVDAARDVVEHTMRHMGLEPGAVVLKGHSLGGAVAAQVARDMHRRGRPVRLWCGRTFSDVAGVVATTAPWPLGSTTYWGAKCASLATGWNLDCASAYLEVPARDRMCAHAHNDSVIRSRASLWHACVKAGDSRRVLLHGPSRRDDPHNLPLWTLRDSAGRTGDRVFWDFCRETF